MYLTITPGAARWYREEMELEPGDKLKFFGKVYGKLNGFSFGIALMDPQEEMVASQEIDGIIYYVDRGDEWFFNSDDLLIDLDPDTQEPRFNLIPRM